jgi:hypothetical protein
MPDESERAAMSKTRGQVAAGIRDPEERRKFIARQGGEEASGRENLTALGQDAYRQRNINAVQGSMKKGGIIRKTGLYRMHKGERVVPKRSKRGRRR